MSQAIIELNAYSGVLGSSDVVPIHRSGQTSAERLTIPNLGKRLTGAVNLLDYIPSNLHVAIAARTDTTDLTNYVDTWLATGAEILYVPAGLYHIGYIRQDITNRLVIYGDGPYSSVFKRVANPSGTTIARMLDIRGSTTQSSVLLSNIGFDGNATNQPAEETPYEFQDSACVQILISGDVVTDSVILDNIRINDPTADGVLIKGNTGATENGAVNNIIVENIIETNRTRTRSGITITGNYNFLNVSDIQVCRFEIETEGLSNTFKNQSVFNNIQCSDAFDVNFKDATDNGLNLPYASISNLIVDGSRFRCDNAHTWLSNFYLAVKEPIRTNGWNKFTNGHIHAYADGWNGDAAIVLEQSTGGAAKLLQFDHVKFTADSGIDTAGVSHIYTNDNTTPTDQELTSFINCRFESTEIKTAYIRNGYFKFIGCDHFYDGADSCIESGNTRNFDYAFFTCHDMRDNRTHSPSAYLYSTPPTWVPVAPNVYVTPIHLVDLNNITATPGQQILFTDEATDLSTYDDSIYGGSGVIRNRLIVDKSDSIA